MVRDIILTVLAATLFLLSCGTVFATTIPSQPYVGGFFKSSTTYMTSSKVLVDLEFWSTGQATLFPSGDWLSGVESVAGSNGNLDPNGWVYQIGTAQYQNDSVNWQPQAWPWPAWGINTWYGIFQNVGDGSYVSFYERMDVVNSTTVEYRLFAYSTLNNFIYDEPIIYTQYESGQSISNFAVGWYYYDGYNFDPFQFGVESPQAINTTDWQTIDYRASYYNSSTQSWVYDPAYVLLGGVYVDCISDASGYPSGYSPMRVGGITYTGVNLTGQSTDYVTWGYTGATVLDGTQIWSSSGTVSDWVKRPYGP
jgi:hypothetical protein